jgi:hypothetical protein
MKYFLILLTVSIASFSFGQSTIDWAPNLKLKLTDFDSPETEINSDLKSYSIYSGANMDFSFHMSTYEFMFTKNFNSKIKCSFNKKAAIIIAHDSLTARQLVEIGQYEFDLCELYTRRFRKELNEKKEAFSNFNFYEPIFKKLQEEMNAQNARIIKKTDLGLKKDLLKAEHMKVLDQINSLSDYCFSCKPPKKKKRKMKTKHNMG